MEKEDKYCLVTLKYFILEKNKKGKSKLVDEKTEKIIITGNKEDVMDKIKHAEDSLTGNDHTYSLPFIHKLSKYLKRYASHYKYSYYRLLKI